MQLTERRRLARHTGARTFVVPLLRVALTIAALWALRRELTGVELHALIPHLRAFGWSHVALGAACTVGSFVVLGIIELLALRHTEHDSGARVSARGAMVTAFVANALSQSIGIALLTGAAVRARAYARYGLNAIAIAQVTAFVTITATVGLLAAGAVSLLATPSALIVGGRSIAVRPFGTLLAGIVLAYIAWSVVRRGASVGYGRWRLARPTPAIAASQVMLSIIDWLLAGAVLYAFMPTSLHFSLVAVLGAYMIAQVIAVTSHVPAGAGILEVVVLALLANAPTADRSAIVAALVLFRLMYYLAPLCVATLIAGGVELARAWRAHTHGVAHVELRARRAG